MRGGGGHTKRRNAYGIASNSFSVLSVSFDSLAPARLALQANLRSLYLKGPAFSIVVNSVEDSIKDLWETADNKRTHL